MTIDDAILMAYADGELDPAAQKRVERAMAADPALAERAASFDAVDARIRAAFAPIAREPVPERFTAMLTSNVVAIAPKRATPSWPTGLALAASLLLGIGVGTHVAGSRQAPLGIRDGSVVATGPLARALDTQLASTAGDVRMLVSFHGQSGYCRVFASSVIDGIACRSGDAWQLRQTRSGRAAFAADYRQAASADAALLAEAQNMMVGAPLDSAAEERARAAGWR